MKGPKFTRFERYICNVEAEGSTPSGSTNIAVSG